MNDDDFEQIRSSLSPAEDQTTRLGGLFVLESMLDDDDRIVSLVSTLLRDRDASVVAASAKLAYGSHLYLKLHEELDKAWTSAPQGYREALLESLTHNMLHDLVSYYVTASDPALRLAYLEKLASFGPSAKLEFVALELSRDEYEEVRSLSAETLGKFPNDETCMHLESMLDDPKGSVVAKALGSLAPHVDNEKLAIYIQRLQQEHPDLARKTATLLHERQNESAVQPLLAKQTELVDHGRYDEALALAAKIFMRVTSHPECQYQMARAAAGLGDDQRALRLLANAFENGYADKNTPTNDPLFEKLRSHPDWEQATSPGTTPQ